MKCQWLIGAESLRRDESPKLKTQQVSLKVFRDEKNDLLNRNVE